ncbi:uncharacterized protein EURHEDRAFT_417608 [Aspergillus ruber CBS 135680]|uniref:Uncharacterized protein n=1 Tax=Aspergillus ruber (strain CBS 135680) TaxID=1388766 RepID=A0A017S0U4_ASPRC|nr:uncharacterized protein EURHEDRAFT_417608 [Aspergillus ruber CBS 135680]EYE90254.1 hypothetical protein EURHEDRAFT_417608 [Aspergillus ruber CBS 135680]
MWNLSASIIGPTINLRPPLYIDIEGKSLSRHGKVSLLTMLVYPEKALSVPTSSTCIHLEVQPFL